MNDLLTKILYILREILITLTRGSNPGIQEDIDLSVTDFTPDKPFQLYVGVEETVIGEDNFSKLFSRHFIPGYHPFLVKKITKAGTTATSLAAFYHY